MIPYKTEIHNHISYPVFYSYVEKKSRRVMLRELNPFLYKSLSDSEEAKLEIHIR